MVTLALHVGSANVTSEELTSVSRSLLSPKPAKPLAKSGRDAGGSIQNQVIKHEVCTNINREACVLSPKRMENDGVEIGPPE